MMDASYDLLASVIARLKATSAVSAYVGTKVYDRAPQDPEPASPYITMGPTTSIPSGYDCLDGEQVTIQIDIWSWGSGEAFSSAECRQIAGAVRRALHDKDLPLSGNALVTLQHALTRIMRDPDGVTNHGAVQFTAEIEVP